MPESKVMAAMRPWTIADAPVIVDAAAQDQEVASQVRNITETADAEALIAEWNAHVESESAGIWAITLDDAVVGAIGVSNIERRHRSAWCWYWLMPAGRGQGLATRALATAAAWAFDQQVFRLELGHRVENEASCAVAQRAGFAAEGIERQKLEYDGVRYDCETHARLATDPAADIEPLPMSLA